MNNIWRKTILIIGILLIILGILIMIIMPYFSSSLVLGAYTLLPLGFILLIIFVALFKPYQISITGAVSIVIGVIIVLLNENTSLESAKAALPIFFLVFIIPSGGLLILVAIIKAIYLSYKK